MKKFVKIIFLIIAMIINVNLFFTFAEQQEKTLINLEEEKDLIVTFVYDKEIVDISFIDPEGNIKNEIENTSYDEGSEKYRIYSIKKAIAGEWKIRYDKQNNESIEFYVVEGETSLLIKDYKYTLKDNSLLVEFYISDKDNKQVQYEIFAVNADEHKIVNESEENYDSSFVKLKEGPISSNTNVTMNVDLKDLPTGTYTLKLNVSREQGNFEIFDTVTFDDIFKYENPFAPNAMEEFNLYIDKLNGHISIDFEKWKINGAKKYRVLLYENGGTIYKDELEPNKYSTKLFYDKKSTELKVSIEYMIDKIWSNPKTKIINIDKIYLDVENYEIIGDSYLSFKYCVDNESELYINVNDNEIKKKVNGSGKDISYLKVGNNDIYALLTMPDNISFEITCNKTYNILTPEIILYEDYDGKNVFSSSINIIGKVLYCEKLTVNGKSVTLIEMKKLVFIQAKI